MNLIERLRHTAEHGIFTASLNDQHAGYGEAADCIEALTEALELFACLEIPAKPQGNAGLYSVPFKRIEKARAAIAKAKDHPND